MNSGTFYLYEYENNKRRRNVGFIKVSRHYRSCILQIHARGIPVGNGASLELYAFYRDDADLIAEQIAVLNCFRKNVSARLPIAESRFPEGRPLPQIDGFFLRLPGGQSALFWMASAFFFDVDMGRLKTASEAGALSGSTEKRPALSDTVSAREERPCTALSEPGEQLSAADALGPEAALPSENILQPEETCTSPEILAAEDDSPEKEDPVLTPETAARELPEEPLPASAPVEPTEHSEHAESSEPAEPAEPAEHAEHPEPAGHPSARKIQRSDIAQLPRRFWPLANNSFLLHGYHNYNHLMLIEEEGRTWLGVPGVYAPQEARAADLFGFPRFTRSCAAFPELTDEERDDSGDFGHWCRCVGNSRSR